jgi:hypothetical protein
MQLTINERLLRIMIYLASAALLVWCIANAFKFPIYSDETAYKLFLERFFINGGFKQSVTPYCNEGFLVRPPTALIPAAVAWSLISNLGIGFLSYRLIPILCWMSILTALFIHGRRHADQSFWPLMLLVTLGPSLYGLVILRPEIVLLAIAALMYVVGSSLCKQKKAIPICLVSGFLTLLFSFAVYMHPKAVYLAPALIAVFIFGAQNLQSRGMRFTFLGIYTVSTIVIAVSAIHLHQLQYLTCAAYPSLTETMKGQAVNPLELLTDPVHFFMKCKEAFSAGLWEKTAQQLSYSSSYEVSFLPGSVINTYLSLRMIRFLIVGFLLLIFIMTLFKIVYQIAAQKCSGMRNEYVLLLLVSVGLIGPFFLNLTKHFYDVSLLVGAIAVMASLAWSLPFHRQYKRLHPVCRMSSPYVFPCALILMGLFAADLNARVFTAGIDAGYEGPSISIHKIIDRKDIREKIDQAFLAHGISHEESLIVDDFTYDLVKTRPVLYPITYLSVNEEIARDLPNNVKSFGLHYGITRCSYLVSFQTSVNLVVLQVFSNAHPDLCMFRIL